MVEIEISDKEMRDAKTIVERAKEKCICRTERVMLAAAIYSIKLNADYEMHLTQDQVASHFKCSVVSLRQCFHAMYGREIINVVRGAKK